MVRKVEVHDIADAPDIVSLAEDVARTGVAHVLTRDGEPLVRVSPVPNKQRRRRSSHRDDPSSLNDWLGDLLGIGESPGAGDISANIHRYVAEALSGESQSSRIE